MRMQLKAMKRVCAGALAEHAGARSGADPRVSPGVTLHRGRSFRRCRRSPHRGGGGPSPGRASRRRTSLLSALAAVINADGA